MPSELLSEPPRPRLHRGRVRHPVGVRILRTLLRLAVVLLIGGLVGGSYYLAKKGFSRSWRKKVVEELHKRGVEASVRRLTLDPFRGLIARDVRIYDYKKREKTLAVVSELSLDINYAALFHKQPFLNAFDIRNSNLTIPLPPTPGQVANAEIKNFRAHVYFPPERIEVSQAEGVFCGIRISASGQLIKREDYQPSPEDNSEESARRLALLQRLVTLLQRFRYPGATPELQVKFSGDLAQLEDARVDATLRGRQILIGTYEARNLRLLAAWKDQTLTIPQLEWSDQAGRFSGTASWSRANGHADFQARSNIDPKLLLSSLDFGGMLEGINFQTSPFLEVSGSATIGAGENRFQAIGKVALGTFTYQDIGFEGLTCNFAWDGTRTMVRDIRLRHQSGPLNADVYDAPNDFRLIVESSVVPNALAPLAPVRLRPFLAEWEWGRSPNIHLNLHGTSRDPATWQGDGTLAFGRTRFRGVWMDSASANVKVGDGVLALENFRIARDKGTGSGSFAFDTRRNELRLTNVQTNLKPVEAIMWVDPKLYEQVSPYRFNRPPRVNVNGVVQFGGGKQTHLEINVDGPNGLDYTFIDKVLPFDRIAAKLLFTDDRLQIFGLNGTLFGGSLTGTADISLARGDRHYTAQMAVKNVEFPAVTDLYFKYKTSQGALGGKFDFGGNGSDKKALHGTGNVEVTNGNVFAIPVFGPLSELVNKLSGMGYSQAHEATAPFSIKNGMIHTDNLKISGNLFSMLGHGDLNFVENALDFDIRMNAGGPGAVLTPLYKLFEYHGEGTLTKPVWRPKRF